MLKIVLSENVKTIGLYAFGSCESLRAIEVDKRNPYYCSHQGDLYTKDMRELLQYAIAKEDEIAKHFGITKAAVSNAMQRIYTTLKKFLEKF